MSGYGTKKRGGDVALQLTFPDVASAVVATNDPTPYGYVGRAMFGKASLPVADDLQQRYHAEKSHYANKSAMDGVHNEERSDWLLRHNTYGYTQPRPKLAQRVFANPSLGNQADIYPARNDVHRMRGGFKPNTRESYPGFEWWFDFSDWLQENAPYISEHGWDLISYGAPGGMGPGGHYKPPSGVLKPVVIDPKKARVMEGGLHGGVLRTAEGQRYGRNLLKARIAQLNAIEGAVPGISDGPIGATRFPKKPEIPEGSVPPEALVEFMGTIGTVYGVFDENRNFGNLRPAVAVQVVKLVADALKMLLKIAVDFSIGDYNDTIRYLQETGHLAERFLGGPGRANPRPSRTVEGIVRQIYNMYAYLQGLKTVVNRPRRERVLMSNNLIKTLGIGSLPPEGAGRVRGGEDPPKNLPGVPTPPSRPPPPPSGVDFSKGETQGYRVLSAPAMPNLDADLAPEEPEEEEETTVEKNDRRARALVTARDTVAQRPRGAKFTEDQRIRFGDRQGAYYGEEIGERVPVVPVPVPVESDGTYVHPGSGYVRETFPKFAVQKKPSNSLKPRRVAPTPKLPMFQDTASGIFKAPRTNIPVVKSLPGAPPFSYTGGRAGLPKTVEGFMELAEKLKGSGHKIRVNPTSKLTSIRQNFIRNLLL